MKTPTLSGLEIKMTGRNVAVIYMGGLIGKLPVTREQAGSAAWIVTLAHKIMIESGLK